MGLPPENSVHRFWTRQRQIVVVLLLAALLRVWAAWQLPVDFDEPIYLQAGYDYAHALRNGDLGAVIDYPLNREHPALVKLLYAGSILAQGRTTNPENVLLVARLVSVVFGVLSVWLVAILDPLAGALLAVQTTMVKYTSQAYLDAVPLFTIVFALFALLHSKRPRDRWFLVSAMALGATAAGKYSYFPVFLVILFVYLREKQYPLPDLGLYLLAAGAAFLVLDPSLWRDPIQRLVDSITFHAQYSQSSHVQSIGYPWYQPFVWIFTSAAVSWHPEVFFYYGIDGLAAVLGALGWPREWRERRWIAVWIVTGMVFLLLWPTKWPQYSLVVIPAFCLSAAMTARRMVARVREEDTYWSWMADMIPRPSKSWVLLSSFVLFIMMGAPVFTAIQNGLHQRGWGHLSPLNSVLPGYTVNDIVAASERKMILGTDGGAVIFTLSAETQLPESWEVLRSENSGLPGNRVLDVEIGQQGELWFGTQAGLARYQAGAWQAFGESDFGLSGQQVMVVKISPAGQIWVGTDAGLAVYDGFTWKTYDPKDAGLSDHFVMSLALQPHTGKDVVWVGTRTGLAQLDPQTGRWSRPPQEANLGSGGVADLLVDASGKLWAATLGGGLSVWDGQNWTHYRVSNSTIPSNTVGSIFEAAPGVYWIAAVNPTNTGGVLVKFDGQNWQQFTPGDSGFSGAEPLAFALDPELRLWIGTRTAGVDLYRLPQE